MPEQHMTGPYKMIMGTVKMIFILALLVFVVFLTRNANKEFDYIGQTADRQNEITISGLGEVVAVPDVAKLNVSVWTEASQVAAAQNENTEKMNNIIKSIKDLRIDEKDIRTTNYNISSQYDYIDGQRTFRGYRVSQGLDITIRDLSKSSNILTGVTKLGANQVGNLRFEVDEIEDVKQEARLIALENAKEKAEEMADALGVKLGKVIKFSEQSDGGITPFLRSETLSLDAAFEEGVPAPQIEPGSQEIKITVFVSFELL